MINISSSRMLFERGDKSTVGISFYMCFSSFTPFPKEVANHYQEYLALRCVCQLNETHLGLAHAISGKCIPVTDWQQALET